MDVRQSHPRSVKSIYVPDLFPASLPRFAGLWSRSGPSFTTPLRTGWTGRRRLPWHLGSMSTPGSIAVNPSPNSVTSMTLLMRLQQSPADQSAWKEFVECYGHRIAGWCRQWGLQEADAQDVAQTVLLKLVQ